MSNLRARNMTRETSCLHRLSKYQLKYCSLPHICLKKSCMLCATMGEIVDLQARCDLAKFGYAVIKCTLHVMRYGPTSGSIRAQVRGTHCAKFCLTRLVCAISHTASKSPISSGTNHLRHYRAKALMTSPLAGQCHHTSINRVARPYLALPQMSRGAPPAV